MTQLPSMGAWQGVLSDNPSCEICGLCLFDAIELTQVLFIKFGAGLDMDLLLDASEEEKVMIVVTELLNICATSDQANSIVKNADLIGFYHRYVTRQL